MCVCVCVCVCVDDDDDDDDDYASFQRHLSFLQVSKVNMVLNVHRNHKAY